MLVCYITRDMTKHCRNKVPPVKQSNISVETNKILHCIR